MRYVEGREALFQERLLDEPFWMLVLCQLVNLTSINQAEPVFDQIRVKFPEVENLAYSDSDELVEILRPLGLYNRRARSLRNFAYHVLCFGLPKSSSDVRKYPGCGQYASDSWKIFVEKNLDVSPNDGRLQWYLHRERTKDDNRA